MMRLRVVIYLGIALMVAGCPEGCEDVATDVAEAQEDSDFTLIWRGFQHAWHNKVHRMAAFGSWIEVDEHEIGKKFSLHHLARSGTDSDQARFSGIYDAILAGHTRFIQDSVSISVNAPERQSESFERHVIIEETSFPRLAGKHEVAVVLNGFKLRLREGACKTCVQKLGTLELRIAGVDRTPVQIDFDIVGEIMMSCQSIECWFGPGPNEDAVFYDLDVVYLVIAGEEEWFHAVRHSPIVIDYPYNSEIPVPETLGTFSGYELVPNAQQDFIANTIGLRGFHFQVEKNKTVFKPDVVPHLYKWKMWIELTGGDSNHPTVRGQAFFAHSNKGAGNSGHEGQVHMRLYPTSLQFGWAAVTNCKWTAFENFPGFGEDGDAKKTRSEVFVNPWKPNENSSDDKSFGCL